MSFIDWAILSIFLAYTIWDGSRKGTQTKDIKGYFLANRGMSWGMMGFSVMATQASAITFIGTTGLAYIEDMRFIQIYLSIPFAMVILCLTLVPFYYKMKNYSVYEVLENRFGLSTRLLTSSLFLLSRGLSLGTVIAAPAYVLSLLLNLPLNITILIIGITATLYTIAGGANAVIRTDVKQMTIMIFGLVFSFVWIMLRLPEQVSISDTFYLAGTLGKLKTLDIQFDLTEKYNIWSGVIASLFLMLSYFGSDQSQVQRYLAARSLDDAKGSLLVSGFAKVPMQFSILLLGVMLYIFYIFSPAPLTFRAVEDRAVKEEQAYEGKLIRQSYEDSHNRRKNAALDLIQNRDNIQLKQAFLNTDREILALRNEEIKRIEKIEDEDYNDTNYIFPYFILNEIPIGFIGIIIAGIFAAALSSIDSGLNALSTCSIVDWYRRLHKEKKSENHYLNVSRYATLLWGVLATLSALALGETDSIVELINKIGSYFYGSILGVFVLLLWVKRAGSKGAFIGLLAGMFTVFLFDSLYYNPTSGDYSFFLPSFLDMKEGLQFPMANVKFGYQKSIEYLWLNPLGTGVVVIVGYVSGFFNNKNEK